MLIFSTIFVNITCARHSVTYCDVNSNKNKLHKFHNSCRRITVKPWGSLIARFMLKFCVNLCVSFETQMLVILSMNARVFLLFMCSIQICISLGNTLDHESSYEANADEENGTKRDQMRDALEEFDMSYLKCSDENCELIKGSVKELPEPGPWEVENIGPQNTHTRSKRKIFLPDNRLRIRENSVGRFPFNSAVAIRVNGEVKCSGVALLRPRFFLTAAHCVQPDDRRKDLEVGVLSGYREMLWSKVVNTRVHRIWKSKRKSPKIIKMWRLKDYAVLETKTPLPVTPMSIGYVGADADGNEILRANKTYMYFSAFDDERRSDDLNMRFCQMKKIKPLRIFSRCDTVPKTAGAGVYIRMRNKETGRVERKVIAIATGDYGVKDEQKYSVALRINSRMFPHICRFVTGSYGGCN
ncbi:inactive serine protease 35-like [Dendronephthya gigantea]|uniref:inactive serine protease 35-like n=1 Tax=Dendronephthya gigantea TaxID=151771 RepID=UPI00106C7916|nr:inactive serine protease 35-like [Dendronephthya gigantea]